MNIDISLSKSSQKIQEHLSSWKHSFSQWVKYKAIQSAGRKQPKETGDNIMRYIGGFSEKAQQCISELDKFLNITSLIYAVRQMREKRDAEVFKLRQKIEALYEKLMQVSDYSDQSLGQLIRWQSVVFMVLLLLLAIAEGFLSYPPFLYLTGNRNTSIVIACVFAGLWAISAHKFSDSWNRPGRLLIVRRILLLIGFSVAFYTIAHLRALQRVSVRAIINNEPLPRFFDVNYFEVFILTIVGWFFFLGGVFLVKHSPTISEVRAALMQVWNKRRARKTENEIAKTQEQIEAENQKVAQAEYEVISIVSARKAAIKEIVSYLYLMVSEFKSINTSARVDGVIPDCFDESVHFDLDASIPNIHEDFDPTFNEGNHHEQSKIS